jgi:transcriptional regulator with GAF, ATPase, and Fis domain
LTQLAGHTKIPSPEDPAAALAAVVALRRLAERLERAAVARAIEQGWTWAQVAEALGVTRQAAHKRHAARRD